MSSNKSDSPGRRKRRWFEGLYARFSAAFMLILLVTTAFNTFVTTEVWVTLAEDVEQRRNWNLAEQFALRLQPDLARGADADWIQGKLFDFTEFYPTARIYLLDENGRVMQHSMGLSWGVRIDQIPLAVLHKATQETMPSLPLRSFDPESAEPSVFSATKTVCEGQPCYLYVTLTAGLFNLLQDRQGEYYLVTYLVILLGVGLLLAGCMSAGLFFLLSQGFRDMLAMVRAIELGDYSGRIPLRGNDEIAEISQAINHMAAAVEDSVEALAKTDQQRRALIANISHDLRGPLTVIEGFLETVLRKDEQLSPQQRKEHLERIYKNVLQQKQLTSDLFELSKLEAQDRVAAKEAFSLLELVYDAAQKYQPQAAEKQMEISVNTEVDPGAVLADISMIDRVLSNLISNAIRYCPNGAKIDLLVEDRGAQVQVSVRDTGNGIPKSALAHIFDSFYRVESDRSRVSGGSGLGLAIVKKMLESNDSEIQVESEEGKGCCFYFSLPKAEHVNTE